MHDLYSYLQIVLLFFFFFFFFNDTATTEIYTLSLHDALPISNRVRRSPASRKGTWRITRRKCCGPEGILSGPNFSVLLRLAWPAGFSVGSRARESAYS